MRNFKAQATILAVVFVAVVSVAIGYFYLQSQNPKGESPNVGNDTKTIPDAQPKEVPEAKNPTQPAVKPSPPIPPPSDSVDETAGWQSLKMKDLEYKLPPGWWHDQGKNSSLPVWWVELNPRPVADPYDTMPVFNLRVDTDKATLEQFKQERIKTYYLVEVKEEKRVISGNEWTILTGRPLPDKSIPNPQSYTGRFKVGTKAKFALFVNGDDDYQLLGDVAKDEEAFDQILATFKFTAAKDEEQPGNSISVQMIAQNDTGESGTAVITDLGGNQIKVLLKLDNVPGSGQDVYIYKGSCQKLGSVAYYLSKMDNGLATNLAPGQSETILGLSLGDLRWSLPLTIGVRYAASVSSPFLASCGDIK